MTRATWWCVPLLALAGCGGSGGPSTATPATGPDAPATRADVEALARSLERLRAEVEQLRAERPDAERQFFAGELARFRAALRRGRTQVVAWKATEKGEMLAVGDRALQTIDHFVGALDQVPNIDGLIGWYDTYLSTRQQWPPNQAWLLPELVWK